MLVFKLNNEYKLRNKGWNEMDMRRFDYENFVEILVTGG